MTYATTHASRADLVAAEQPAKSPSLAGDKLSMPASLHTVSPAPEQILLRPFLNCALARASAPLNATTRSAGSFFEDHTV